MTSPTLSETQSPTYKSLLLGTELHPHQIDKKEPDPDLVDDFASVIERVQSTRQIENLKR